MKETPNPHVLYSSQSKEKSETGRKKTFTALNFIIAAAKKVTGRVFRIFLPRQSKSDSNKGAIDDSSTTTTTSVTQFNKQSYSTDNNSTESSSSSNVKSFTKSSRSYGNSSSYKSGQQDTTINFSFEELCKATEKFSPANIIGEGGSGTVYKGKLKDGSMVAVKRARKSKHDQFLLKEFKNEILTLSKIEHLNLVKLLGFVEHGDEKIIVVEYVGNGTLREHLDGKRGNGLEVAERLDIAIDVAHALTYLHTYSDPPIIHRDVKASNILITEKLRAKVTDFGFARMFEEDSGATHISTQVKGTAGYLDPDYLRTYQLTEKSDVYSFGVLLVEMMTGRYPIESKKPMKERITIKWAMQSLNAGDAIFVMDPRLRRSPASNMAVEMVLRLAHDCLAPARQSRPTMKKCAEILWKIRKDFREKPLSPPPPPPPSSAPAYVSHHSLHNPTRDAKDSKHMAYGIDEGDNKYKFVSA